MNGSGDAAYSRPVARKLVRLSIRFSPRTHALIKQEAAVEGVGVTQFIREAALARAYFAMGQRGESPEDQEAEGLIEAIRAVLREQDARHHRRPPADD